MKIRNILSVLFVGLLFTSCNSEEEVQRGNEDGRDISFSMTLTLGEVTAMTKAGGDIAEGYTYSTEDEVKVNNVVVAIFNEANGTVGECLEYKSVAFDGGIPNSTVTIDGKTLIAYKIDNIQAKTGKVRIVAIANSTHYEDLARLGTTTYENLKGLSETVSGGTFDASNLVKVGELAAYDLNTAVTSIPVPCNSGIFPMIFATLCLVLASQCCGIVMIGTLPTLRLGLSFASLWGVISFSISGFSFPVMAMHPVLQALSNLFPLRHYFLIYVDQALNGYSMAYSWTNYMALLIFMMLPFFVVHRLKEALVYYKYIP